MSSEVRSLIFRSRLRTRSIEVQGDGVPGAQLQLCEVLCSARPLDYTKTPTNTLFRLLM